MKGFKICCIHNLEKGKKKHNRKNTLKKINCDLKIQTKGF